MAYIIGIAILLLIIVFLGFALLTPFPCHQRDSCPPTAMTYLVFAALEAPFGFVIYFLVKRGRRLKKMHNF